VRWASGAPWRSQSALTPSPVPTSMMAVAPVAATSWASAAPVAGVIGSIPISSEE